MESKIAGTFQAMVNPDAVNTQMKDFYDIRILSRTFNFNLKILTEAVENI